MTPLPALLAHHHHESFRIAAPGALQDAAGASALVMIGLIVFLSAGVLVFALVLRRRSLHPSPEAILLAEVGTDTDGQSVPPRRAGGRPNSRDASPPRRAWEKPDDWWKSSSSP